MLDETQEDRLSISVERSVLFYPPIESRDNATDLFYTALSCLYSPHRGRG